MKKKFEFTFTFTYTGLLCLLCLFLTMTACKGKEPVSRPVFKEVPMPLVMADGTLYLGTGEQVKVRIDEKDVDGRIISETESGEEPAQDGQSNFGGIGAEYAYYRDGIVVKIDGVWELFSKKRFYLDEVLELAGKGNTLSWEDLEPYSGKDIGSGLKVICFYIDKEYYLVVGGNDSAPVYALLVRTETEESVDIRTGDVEEFILGTEETSETGGKEENAEIGGLIEQLGLAKSGEYSRFYEVLDSYQNPIDLAYLELLQGDNDSCEAERRLYQDSYGAAWRKEFYHAAITLYDAFSYEEDKLAVTEYVKATENYISCCVQVLLFYDVEEYNQTPPEKRDLGWGIMGGNGTRSWLNEEKGCLYREAALRLIEQYEAGGAREYEYLTDSFEPAEGIGTEVPEIFQ